MYSIKKLIRLIDETETFIYSPNVKDEEIRNAVENNRLINDQTNEKWTMEQHIERIAWFVVKGWDDAITLNLDDTALWPIVDGNHRFIAAKFKGQKYILANATGSMERLLYFMKNSDANKIKQKYNRLRPLNKQ